MTSSCEWNFCDIKDWSCICTSLWLTYAFRFLSYNIHIGETNDIDLISHHSVMSVYCTRNSNVLFHAVRNSWLYLLAFQWVSQNNFGIDSGVEVAVGTSVVGRVRVLGGYVTGKCYINDDVCFAAYKNSLYKENGFYEVGLEPCVTDEDICWFRRLSPCTFLTMRSHVSSRLLKQPATKRPSLWLTSKKASKLRITDLLVGESTDDCWFPLAKNQ